MKTSRLYAYVGPTEIKSRVKPEFEGRAILQIDDIALWIKETQQELIHDSIICTFIIDENRILKINDRHSEHVACSGGKAVLSAGEITFAKEKGGFCVSEISNQSTGFCPEPDSWCNIMDALDKIGILYPEYFTTAFDFRYCYNCNSINLIKNEVYECAICDNSLDLEWNFNKV